MVNNPLMTSLLQRIVTLYPGSPNISNFEGHSFQGHSRRAHLGHYIVKNTLKYRAPSPSQEGTRGQGLGGLGEIYLSPRLSNISNVKFKLSLVWENANHSDARSAQSNPNIIYSWTFKSVVTLIHRFLVYPMYPYVRFKLSLVWENATHSDANSAI